MNRRLMSTLLLVAYANDNDAFIPEVWAQESLMILENNMIAANLVHRDFENEIANYGDVVNTRRPNNFSAQRKGDTDDVTVQDATATNVPVMLNQHIHTSFIIKDGEASKSMKDLVTEYLHPAAISIAQACDQIVLGQVYRFLPNSVGAIGTAMSRATVVAAREKMNQLKVPQGMGQRNMILTPTQEGDLLNIEGFVNANSIGDDGTALKSGSLGQKYGFNMYLDQNAPSILSASTIVTGAINLTAGYPVGTKVLVVDGFTGALVTGSWITIGGIPYRITAHTEGSGNTTGITLGDYGLLAPAANDAVITVFAPALVDFIAGYAAKWYKGVVYNTITPIKVGQLVSDDVDYFAALDATTSTSVVLDRPTVTALANDDVLGLGPSGEYGLAFHRNAISFVSRPLAQPRKGTGALSSVAAYNGLGLRVTITYDGTKQGHLVTLDILAGVEVLDQNLGVPILR